MNIIVQNYAYHLDNLRRKYKITVDDLCGDICDSRLYRRYLSGERTLTHLKIIEFCEKLGISPSDFYYSASEKDRYELRKIKELYKTIVSRDFTNFQKIHKSINKDMLISIQNERFLDFCILKAEYINKATNSKNTLDKASLVADYPNCIKKSAFDFVDLISLQLIAQIEVEFKKEIALNKLIQILNNKDMIYISSESSNILPSIYANVSLFLSRLNKYEDSNSVSDSGIKYSILHSDFGSLSHLRYVKALSLLKLGYVQEAEIEAIKCLSNAISKENPYELEMFHRELISDFKKDPLELIPKYKKQILYKK
ncbi:MAG: hypothetical protein KQ78_00394 [Candidatus Izimaplasma bacterium HR2]|nr:MAG: hypothetical protein KQ78_00394 [Candidatus Izimaplasma bacterium HR2]